MCHQQDISPLPLDRIQGDIKPLIQHLDFRGRFRRCDLVSLINKFHAKRSRIAPHAITEYRPREANAIADFLAGCASAALNTGGSNCDGLPDVPFDVPTDPHYELLLAENAVVLGPHQHGKVVLVLHEFPGCDFRQMAGYAQWRNGQCASAVRCVEYVTPASDAKGRLYARHTSAQNLPRDLRLLLYGGTHKEVDISGAHYELIRALCASTTLPPCSSPTSGMVKANLD